MQSKKQKIEIREYFAARNLKMQTGYTNRSQRISKEEHLKRVKLEQSKKLRDALKELDTI